MFPPLQPLLSPHTRHLERTDTPESKFGRIVLNDPRFVSDLRAGREPTARIAAKVCAYIADAQELPH
ncbi:hypothetical protein [Sphingomonas sp.]|uniref:hypothetical protein n=1 Tax=Sphingomonas sp. TaxID=28214 RepID=UPI000DB827BD|nr:hypothetical protein [Sphingomonas sp.]PZU10921.1 MAG: hypothetical protein DI605_04705 [Sphingomonas sp.]